MQPRPSPVDAQTRSWCATRLFLALTAVATFAAGFGCTRSADPTSGAFWLRAAPAAIATLDPPPPPGAPGIVARTERTGEVRSNAARPGTRDLNDLVVDDREGRRWALRYRLGAGRRLPVDVGDLVRVRVHIRRHAEDEAEDVGMMVWLQTKLPGKLGASEVVASERLVAAVESRKVLDGEALPPPLTAISPTTMAAYHTAGRFGLECDETHQHSWFRFARSGWMRDVRGLRHSLDSRLVAPGTTVITDDGHQRYDVLLIDNRTTTTSGCRVPSEPSWSWAATALDRGRQLTHR